MSDAGTQQPPHTSKLSLVSRGLDSGKWHFLDSPSAMLQFAKENLPVRSRRQLEAILLRGSQVQARENQQVKGLFCLWLQVTSRKKKKNQPSQDFPGGPVVKNLPCNTGNWSLIPAWRTKIPHAIQQLSLRAPTLQLLNQGTTTGESVHCNGRSLTRQQRSSMPQLRPEAAK